VSFVLCLFAYPPFLLTLARWRDIVRGRARLAALGHQVAGWVLVAGWLAAGQPVIAAVHLVWVVVARIWFTVATRPAGERPALRR
jgi:hypothetical protein